MGDDGTVGERGLRTFPGRCVEDRAAGASRCTARRRLVDLKLRATDQQAVWCCVPEHRVGLNAVDRRLAGHEEEVIGLALVGDRDALVAVAVGEVDVRQRGEPQRREVLRIVVDVEGELDVAARQQVVERAVAGDRDRRQSRLRAHPPSRARVLQNHDHRVPLVQRAQRVVPLPQLVDGFQRAGEVDHHGLRQRAARQPVVVAVAVRDARGQQAVSAHHTDAEPRESIRRRRFRQDLWFMYRCPRRPGRACW